MKADEPIKRSGIAAWPTDERPRERLLARGPEASQKQNNKKNEYALAHFAQVNEHLAAEGSPVCNQFNFLSPASFNAFLQTLRDGKLAGFRPALDVRLGSSILAIRRLT